DILIGRGVMNSMSTEPIYSLDGLQESFHRAILARSNGRCTDNWRNRWGISFGSSRMIHFQHYVPFCGTPVLGKSLSESSIEKLFKKYLSAAGNTVVQLNPSHPGAVEIVSTSVIVQPWNSFPFEFVLRYGYEGSIWYHNLASGNQFI